MSFVIVVCRGDGRPEVAKADLVLKVDARGRVRVLAAPGLPDDERTRVVESRGMRGESAL